MHRVTNGSCVKYLVSLVRDKRMGGEGVGQLTAQYRAAFSFSYNKVNNVG